MLKEQCQMLKDQRQMLRDQCQMLNVARDKLVTENMECKLELEKSTAHSDAQAEHIKKLEALLKDMGYDDQTTKLESVRTPS